MKEVSKFRAVLGARCPRCRRGHIFSGSAYAFRLQRTSENCPVCNLKFEREPGFFYVAMFVSYAMSVAEIITIGCACYILGLPLVYERLWHYFFAIVTGVLILSPINYRYSRVILLHYLTPGLDFDSKDYSSTSGGS